MASVDVVDLSGIGPALAARLNELGVFSSSDLLRVSRRRLADLVDGVSEAQVLRWQTVAEFLEVDGLPLPVAEGLYERGIGSLDELGSRSLSALRGHVDALAADGVDTTDPSDDQLVRWIVDAVRLRATGTLNGTVVDASNAPIAAVSVSCLGEQAQADARGRFRLRRLPLGRPLSLFLDHADFVPRTVEGVEAAPAGVVRAERFRLLRPHASTPSPRVLSELNGDTLPSLAGGAVRSRVRDGAPDENDLLRVIGLPDTGEVRAASRLFDYDGGLFIVRVYRLPADNVTGTPQMGEHLRFSQGKWRAASMTARQVRDYRRRLRERHLRPPIPDDPTLADLNRVVTEWLEARRARA
jgi:Domain of unknown function (DUF4332)